MQELDDGVAAATAQGFITAEAEELELPGIPAYEKPVQPLLDSGQRRMQHYGYFSGGVSQAAAEVRRSRSARAG